MTENEIIIGNDEICKLLQWKSSKVYVYEVPNLFPSKDDSGWTEFSTQAIGFHADWNLLIGAYNAALLLLHQLPDNVKELLREDKAFFARWGINNILGVSDVNHQINITSSWLKFVEFAKWYNGIKYMLLLNEDKENGRKIVKQK